MLMCVEPKIANKDWTFIFQQKVSWLDRIVPATWRMHRRAFQSVQFALFWPPVPCICRVWCCLPAPWIICCSVTSKNTFGRCCRWSITSFQFFGLMLLLLLLWLLLLRTENIIIIYVLCYLFHKGLVRPLVANWWWPTWPGQTNGLFWSVHFYRHWALDYRVWLVHRGCCKPSPKTMSFHSLAHLQSPPNGASQHALSFSHFSFVRVAFC